MKKKTICGILIIVFVLAIVPVKELGLDANINNTNKNDFINASENSFIDPTGMTLETRIMVPEGYTRTLEEEGSLGTFIRNYEMKEDGNGKKAFLLAQGFMPAQEFHVLKNPKHKNDPWYYEEEVVYPFVTPQYTFYEGSLRRLEY